MQPQSRIVDLLGEGLKGYYGMPLWVTSLPQTCPQMIVRSTYGCSGTASPPLPTRQLA